LAQAFTRGITKNTDGSKKIDVSFGLVKRYVWHAVEDEVAAEDWKKHTAAKRESENVGKSTKTKAGENRRRAKRRKKRRRGKERRKRKMRRSW